MDRKEAYLTGGNCDGRTGHETAYSRGWDELYDPTES